MIDSLIIYSLPSGIYVVRIITRGVRILTWVPNTDTHVIYGIKRLNKMLKSQ